MQNTKFGYFFSEAFRGLQLNRKTTFSSILALAMCLSLVGSFALLYDILSATITRETQKNQYLAYIDETCSDQSAYAIQGQLLAVPNVATVEFISKEQAKKDFADFLDSDVVSELSSDIFRHRYAISFIDSAKSEATVDAIKQIEGIADVSGSVEVSDGFVEMQTSFSLIMFVICLILAGVSFVVITNTLTYSITSRAEETFVMRLCGVSEFHIKVPLMIEGIIIGILSACVAFGLETGIYTLLYDSLTSRDVVSSLEMPLWGVYAPDVFIAFIAVGTLLGGIAGKVSGSAIGKKKKTVTVRKEPNHLAKI